MSELRVGIIGSRRRNFADDKEQLRTALLDILENPFEYRKIVLVSGGCPKGGDKFAEEFAEEYNLEMIIHYPDRSQLPDKPQRWDFAKINYDRNTLIARDSDILIACCAKDRKGGTEDTIKKFKRMYKDELKDGRKKLVVV